MPHSAHCRPSSGGARPHRAAAAAAVPLGAAVDNAHMDCNYQASQASSRRRRRRGRCHLVTPPCRPQPLRAGCCCAPAGCPRWLRCRGVQWRARSGRRCAARCCQRAQLCLGSRALPAPLGQRVLRPHARQQSQVPLSARPPPGPLLAKRRQPAAHTVVAASAQCIALGGPPLARRCARRLRRRRRQLARCGQRRCCLCRCRCGPAAQRPCSSARGRPTTACRAPAQGPGHAGTAGWRAVRSWAPGR